MAESDKTGVKTLGLKLPPKQHAQFTLVAQLDGLSLTDAMSAAVDLYITTKQNEPGFAERAAAVVEEIEREAAARRGAIEALLSNTSTPRAEPKAQAKRGSEPNK